MKTNFRNEAASCLLAPDGLRPPSRTSAMRIADAARLLTLPYVTLSVAKGLM